MGIGGARGRRHLTRRPSARRRDASGKHDPQARLTPRERSVLNRLVKGRSNKATADRLGISPRTVEAHRAKIMDKMAVSSLSDLVRVVEAAGPDSVSP